MRVLITGGAGFVGANLAIRLAAAGEADVFALDNLHRRGSELNLTRLRDVGVTFIQGDVRELDDLLALDRFDAIVECSAEPSTLAGIDGETAYVVYTNLLGAYNCLELARRDGAQMVFLSTSRIYPVAALNAVAYEEGPTRLVLTDEQALPGVSTRGFTEEFPSEGARTLYGATKLGAELLIAEYAEVYAINTVIDRCGVVAGPWQMGKVDQGVFTYWMLNHHLGRSLRYLGYGGTGKQVRDLLHVDDLATLVEDQLRRPEHWSGVTVNVGGGLEVSLSLVETTELCRELTGNEVPIEPVQRSRPGDVPVYISNCQRLYGYIDWRPTRNPRTILSDIHAWIVEYEDLLVPALAL